MTIRMWTPKPIKGSPVVSLVVASYLNDDARRLDSLMCLLYSLKAQTYPHWEAVVVHDGPLPSPRLHALAYEADPARIHVAETPQRKGQFGHPWRKWGVDRTSGRYVGLSNDDNYYCPVYFEWMVHTLQQKDAQLVHCDMVHSHRAFSVISSKPERGSIDAGNWLVEAEIAKSTPWTDMGFAGDWTYFSALHRRAKKTVKVSAPLFVHN